MIFFLFFCALVCWCVAPSPVVLFATIAKVPPVYLMSCLGKHTWPDGNIYEGSFIRDKKSGRGQHRYPDGQQYTGEFVDDMRQGRGKLLYPHGEMYEGDFHADESHGFGVHTWPTGSNCFMRRVRFKSALRLL